MKLYFAGTNTNQLNPLGDEGGEEVCIANISPKERKKRLDFAIRYFVFTSVILVVLLILDVNPLWRLTLFLPLASSTSSFFQWRDKTWVVLAQRSLRHMTDKKEKIEDKAEANQIKKQAQKVVLKGSLTALVIMILVMLIPWIQVTRFRMDAVLYEPAQERKPFTNTRKGRRR